MGRSKEKNDGRLELRIPLATLSLWQIAAIREGVTLSVWVREACDLRLAQPFKRGIYEPKIIDEE